MNVCGVICEYNPFHNGHALHLAEARRLSGADYLVCAMSGPFTQRGDAARLDKWMRARMALLCGADVVVELPTLYAVRPAEDFARAGVALLRALGATHLAFGAECADLGALQAAAALLDAEDEALSQQTRAGLAQGMCHARARGQALAAALPSADINQPNNALGVAYLRALAEVGVPMIPVLVPRRGAGYLDERLQPFASATACRAAMDAGQWDALARAMPEAAHALLLAARDAGGLHAPAGLDAALLGRLRVMTVQEGAALCGVGEGLESRLLRAARKAGSRQALLTEMKCKRYTRARLSRVLTAALLGMHQSLAGAYPAPPYARLLGLRKHASALVRGWQRGAGVPVITRGADARVARCPVFALDVRAGDLWALGCTGEAQRAARQDYTQRPVII
ncbi:MAG: nucleotidyltransferase family protein [Oscillospiraceae bacterium]|jgi:predicted nucleotidyltransferase|nr:nucleotidyltransferase family protein [Oscillospiraceae bacterium]